MVVMILPLIDFYSRLVQRSEPFRAQAFLAELAVEAFDKPVLSRFPGYIKPSVIPVSFAEKNMAFW